MTILQKLQDILWSFLEPSVIVQLFDPVDGLRRVNVEYGDTLSVLSAWSGPCGFGKKW
jgi:hypothetical protein